MLALLGMADDEATRRAQAAEGPPASYLNRFLWLRCATEGWWEPAVGVGEHVAAGQLLGTVSSIDGTRLQETIAAPADGVPLFMTSSPAVAANGLLLGLGAP